MLNISIRNAISSDAKGIAKMANALNMELDGTKGPFDELVVLRDGFGKKPAFSVLIAESSDGLVGYLLYFDFYNTDTAQRGYWMQDVYVEPAFRKSGAGALLVEELAKRTVREGKGCMAWAVHKANEGARRFYRKLGAKDPEAKILELNGEALWSLAGRGLASGSP